MLPPLPVPPLAWLEQLHTEQRRARMEPQERPIRALERWAQTHGQPGEFGALVLWHLGGAAFEAIRAFYLACTALAREEAAPFLMSCFFYDEAFWPLHVGVALGAGQIDPTELVKELPISLRRRLRGDMNACTELGNHWIECSDYLAGMAKIVGGGNLSSAEAKDFFDGADAMLISAAASLLSGEPNAKAAEHARFAFESSLKGFAIEKGVLTAKSAREKISHHLDKLLVCCQPLLDPSDYQRMDAVRAHFPAVSARYANRKLPRRQLWNCYTETCHVLAVVLRSLGGAHLHPSHSS